MTVPTSHAIGNSAISLELLSAHNIKEPLPEFINEAETVTTAQKTIESVGSMSANWHWGFMKKADRDFLRTYCPGKSNYVYFSIQDNELDWGIYYGLMVWPANERPQNNRVLDFTVLFTYMTKVE